jgi:hypothetical protein
MIFIVLSMFAIVFIITIVSMAASLLRTLVEIF